MSFRFITICLVVLYGGSFAHGLCVKAKMANLRKGPGTKYGKSWTVGKYTPLERLKRVGAWIQVADVDEEKHWVHHSLVTSSISCLTVSVPVSVLRTGPGKKFGLAKMQQADRYTSFKKLDREGRWFKVESSRGEISFLHDTNAWRPLKAVNISF